MENNEHSVGVELNGAVYLVEKKGSEVTKTQISNEFVLKILVEAIEAAVKSAADNVTSLE
jgi:hypothetical protein